MTQQDTTTEELPVLITDPVESAKAAGLRYVSDRRPGIRRKRAGKHFSYIGLDGKPIRDKAELERIKSLGIPPAWTEVWICPNQRGHIQATGLDAKGRKQYRYHPRWREIRDETKYGRMIAFGQSLPKIREHVDHDLGLRGLPKVKVLATAVRLLETTSIRIGNEEYARTNKSYGLTTMRCRHVKLEGPTLKFKFRGKSGKLHTISVRDKKLANIIRRCQELPGQELFGYVDQEGQRHTIGSADVNAYLKEITGQDFTAKDFRTWSGTVHALETLLELGVSETQTQAKKNVVEAIRRTSERLGNTPAICRKSYVHPAVIESYMDTSMFQALKIGAEAGNGVEADGTDGTSTEHGLQPQELAVLTLLRRGLAEVIEDNKG
jgi:DNA topoisomerase-1